MSKLGVEKSLSQITGAFESLIEAMQAHQDIVRETDEQLIRTVCSKKDVILKVPMCFDLGLTRHYSSL